MPPWYQGWDNATLLIDVFLQPWKYAHMWSAPLGGAAFLSSILGFATTVYVWWHAKDALPAGVTATILGSALFLFEEVRVAGIALLTFGSAALIYRVVKRVM